ETTLQILQVGDLAGGHAGALERSDNGWVGNFDRAGDVGIERAVHAVPLFELAKVEVVSQTQIQGQAARNLPIVLRVNSAIILLPPGEERVSAGTAHAPDQER